jgi:Holliday junction resolvasome RuvABC DNA-binding subunit
MSAEFKPGCRVEQLAKEELDQACKALWLVSDHLAKAKRAREDSEDARKWVREHLLTLKQLGYNSIYIRDELKKSQTEGNYKHGTNVLDETIKELIRLFEDLK